MTLNLRHISFKRALEAAKEMSGLTNEEITNRSGLDAASVARYFNPNDSYEPSPQKIPNLCRALGNTITADWVSAQVEDMKPKHRIHDVAGLTDAVMQTTTNNGKLVGLAREIIADGNITPEEAKALQAKLKKNGLYVLNMAESLEPLAAGERGQIYRPGVQGPVNVEMQGEPQ